MTIVKAVIARASISLEELRTDRTVAASAARQVAIAVLVRSLTEEPLKAATALGITIGAAHKALRNLDPVISNTMLPIINDPIGCIEPLWAYTESEQHAYRTATIADCITAAVKASQVEPSEILSERRTAAFVKARQIAMWLAKRFSNRTLPEIGRVLGGRDHTTVLHGARRVAVIVEYLEEQGGCGSAEGWGLQEWAAALWSADWKDIERRVAR